MPDEFNIVILPRAAKDLKAIFSGLLAVSPEGALSVHDQLRKSIELLAILPRRNKVYSAPPGVEPVRSLPVPPYMVFFDVIDASREVRILRVRHAARKPLKRFR